METLLVNQRSSIIPEWELKNSLNPWILQKHRFVCNSEKGMAGDGGGGTKTVDRLLRALEVPTLCLSFSAIRLHSEDRHRLLIVGFALFRSAGFMALVEAASHWVTEQGSALIYVGPRRLSRFKKYVLLKEWIKLPERLVSGGRWGGGTGTMWGRTCQVSGGELMFIEL